MEANETIILNIEIPKYTAVLLRKEYDKIYEKEKIDFPKFLGKKFIDIIDSQRTGEKNESNTAR